MRPVGLDTPGLAGKPDQLELKRQAQLDDLRAKALEIPKTPTDPLQQPRPEKRAEQTKNNWEAQDRAARERGQLWQSGQLRSWESFAKGRGRRDMQPSAGYIEIDAGRAEPQRAQQPKPRKPSSGNDTPGWKQIRAAHYQAATFEERAEDELEPFMGRDPSRGKRLARRVVLQEE